MAGLCMAHNTTLYC